MSTPRESIRIAFKTILDAAGLGVTVYPRLPFEGADPRSVVLTVVSGLNRSPGMGLRRSTVKRGFEEQFRLQVDFYYDDKTEVRALYRQLKSRLRVRRILPPVEQCRTKAY